MTGSSISWYMLTRYRSLKRRCQCRVEVRSVGTPCATSSCGDSSHVLLTHARIDSHYNTSASCSDANQEDDRKRAVAAVLARKNHQATSIQSILNAPRPRPTMAQNMSATVLSLVIQAVVATYRWMTEGEDHHNQPSNAADLPLAASSTSMHLLLLVVSMLIASSWCFPYDADPPSNQLQAIRKREVLRSASPTEASRVPSADPLARGGGEAGLPARRSLRPRRLSVVYEEPFLDPLGESDSTYMYTSLSSVNDSPLHGTGSTSQSLPPRIPPSGCTTRRIAPEHLVQTSMWRWAWYEDRSKEQTDSSEPHARPEEQRRRTV